MENLLFIAVVGLLICVWKLNNDLDELIDEHNELVDTVNELVIIVECERTGKAGSNGQEQDS